MEKIGVDPNVEVDIAVIGAGLSGIAFTRFFLDTHSKCRLLILEQDTVLGGVWSSARVFDAFWCQSPLRQTTFSDIVLQPPSDAPMYYDMFEAKYVAQYLEDYVNRHSYDGRSIRERIWLNSEVQAVEKIEDSWNLRVATGSTSCKVRCAKLIVATGINSLPVIPAYLSDEKCPIEAIHHRDFGAAASRVLAADSVYENVTVIGGGKSAADLAYAAVKAGRKVSWLIRETGGEGPGLFLPAAADPYRHFGEASNTLAGTVLNPSAFKPLGGYASHLHHLQASDSTILGKFQATDRRCKAYGQYQNRTNALPGFANLEPRGSCFWNSAPIGIIQHADFWKVISQHAQIFKGDVSAVTKGAIVLNDGRSIPTDVALCGTGWSSACPFFTPDQIRHLGLPHTLEPADLKEYAEWNTLMHSTEVSRQNMSSTLMPSRLYRGIASLSDDSVLFLGRARVANNFRCSEAQAIWATAYLDGNIHLPSIEERKRDVAYHAMFSKRRYPTRGGNGLNLYSDLIWYTDRLISEAGLETHRKDWWYDWNAPCLASDFKDCKEEYLQKYRMTAEVNGDAYRSESAKR